MTFDEHVRAALDSLPPQLAGALENVAIVIERENAEEPDLYGLFDAPEYMPAKIAIYRKPLEEDFPDPAELEEQADQRLEQGSRGRHHPVEGTPGTPLSPR